MRRILLVILLVSHCGCGRTEPTMAGSKWANALHDADAKVRRKAAFTLGNVGPSDPAVLPALVGALKATRLKRLVVAGGVGANPGHLGVEHSPRAHAGLHDE